MTTARWARLALAVSVLLGAMACARKAPSVVPGANHYPDFVYPTVPPELARLQPALLDLHDRAWQMLQAGDIKGAERGLAAALKQRPDFYPATAALGYVELGKAAPGRAGERFDRVLATNASYLPALVGRALVFLRLDRIAEAIAAYEDALRVDGTLTDVRRRVEALRFQLLEGAVAEARIADQAGEWERARSLYESALRASPDSAFLLRDFGRIEFRLRRVDEALGYASKAAALDASDVATQVLVADIYEARDQLEEAVAALARAAALEPAPGLEARIEALRLRMALARLPPEYQAITGAARLTRGDLAALIATRLEPLLRAATADASVLATDIRAHWAQPWIMAVARAGVMQVFDNHTFQPSNAVRRVDLAEAISRLLALMAQRQPSWGLTWAGDRPIFSDVAPDNLYHQAVSLAVAAGILDIQDGGQFQAGRLVTGAEAVAAMERLQKLAGQLTLGPRG